MKKLLALLLILALTAPGALAVELGEGLDVQIHSVSYVVEEGNATHTQLVLDANFTNWQTETLSLAESVQAQLTFMDKYAFAGELSFGQDDIEPLVQLSGVISFRLPNMVTQAPSQSSRLMLTVNGEAVPVPLETLKPKRTGFAGAFEGPGFDSAEAAALAYVDAMRSGDALAALSTFAIESYVEHADFDAFCDRLKSFTHAAMGSAIPSESPWFTQIQTTLRLHSISQHMYYGYISRIWDEEALGEDFTRTFPFTSEITPQIMRESLIAGQEAFRAEDIEILGIFEMNELDYRTLERTQSESYLNTVARQAASYGCDELQDVMVRLTIGDEEYVQFMQCGRYGDTWFNMSLSGSLSALAGVSAFSGGLVNINEAP